MISVVLSTYNGERFIEKQLDSLRLQTLQPDEVIIRDDCSSDGTLAIISEYCKIYNLTSWFWSSNEKNIGYKEGFYRSIKESKGDYIFLCDQDDEWELNKIETMMRVFRNHPEIWALNCAVELIDVNSNTIGIKSSKNRTNCNFLYTNKELDKLSFFKPDFVLRHNIGPGCAMAIDRRTANGFLNTYNMNLPHDWYMNIIAAVNNGCAFFNESLTRYRIHNNNSIGANLGFFEGIQKKDKLVRIADYKSRIVSFDMIAMEFNHEFNEEEQETIRLLDSMVQFYNKPGIKTLREARGITGYNELSKRNVQLWEIMVALHMDNIIRKIFFRDERIENEDSGSDCHI